MSIVSFSRKVALPGLLLALVLGLIWFAPSFIDSKMVKEHISSVVQKETGLELEIYGELGFTLLPFIGLKLGRTALRNGNSTVATTNRLHARIAVLPLFRKTVMIDRFVADTLVFNAEALPRQEADLESEEPAGSKASGWHVSPRIGYVEFIDCGANWKDKTGTRVAVQDVNMRLGRGMAKKLLISGTTTIDLPSQRSPHNATDTSNGDDGQTSPQGLQRIRASIHVDGGVQGFARNRTQSSGSVALNGILLTADNSSIPFLANAALNVDELSASARITDGIFRIANATLDVTELAARLDDEQIHSNGSVHLSVKRLGTTLEHIGVTTYPKVLEEQPASASLSFAFSPDKLTLDDASVQAGIINATLDLTVTDPHTTRSIIADARINRLDLDTLMELKHQAMDEDALDDSQTPMTPGVFLDMLRSLELDARVRAGYIRSKGIVLRNVDAEAVLHRGALYSRKLFAELDKGIFIGNLAADIATDDVSIRGGALLRERLRPANGQTALRTVASMKVEGSGRLKQYNGTCSIEKFSPRKLFWLVGLPEPDLHNDHLLKNAQARFDFSGSEKEFHVNNAVATIDETDLTLDMILKNPSNPSVTLKVAMDELDLDGYELEKTSGESAGSTGKGLRYKEQEPLRDLRRLTRKRLDLDLNLQRLTVRKKQFSNIVVRGVLGGNRLALEKARFSHKGGTADMAAEVSFTGRQAKARIDATITDINPMLFIPTEALPDNATLDTRLDGSCTVHTTGTTENQLLDNIRLNTTLTAHQPRIQVADEKIFLQEATLRLQMSRSKGHTPLSGTDRHGYNYSLRLATIPANATQPSINSNLGGALLYHDEKQVVDLVGSRLFARAIIPTLPTPDKSLVVRSNFSLGLNDEELDLDAFNATIIGMLNLNIEAHLRDLFSQPYGNGTFMLGKFSPEDLRQAFGKKEYVTKTPDMLDNVSLATRFSLGKDNLNLDDIDITFDKTEATGYFHINDFTHPELDGDLHCTYFNVNDYLPVRGPGHTPKEGDIPLEFLRWLKGTARTRVDTFLLYGIKLENVDIKAESYNGRIRSHHAHADFFGGTFNADISGLASSRKLTGRVLGDFKTFSLGQMMTGIIGRDMLTGKTDLHANLTFEGTTDDGLLRGMNGNASLLVKDGSFLFTNPNDPTLPEKERKRIRESRTMFSTAKGTVTFTNGSMHNDDLYVHEPLALRVNGKGVVDLVQEDLDYDINARIMSAATVALNLDGSFDDVSVNVNTLGTVTGTTTDLITDVLTLPFNVLKSILPIDDEE